MSRHTYQICQLTGDHLNLAVAAARDESPYLAVVRKGYSTAGTRLLGQYDAEFFRDTSNKHLEAVIAKDYLKGVNVLELIEEFAIGCKPISDATWEAESAMLTVRARGYSFIEAVLRCYVYCRFNYETVTLDVV